MGEHEWNWASLCTKCGCAVDSVDANLRCPIRPTVQVMDGETGEDGVGEQPWAALRAFFGELPDDLVCPAPTPRAP